VVGSGRGNSSNKFIHLFEIQNEKLMKFLFFRLNEIGVSFWFFYSLFLPSDTVNENEVVKFVLVFVLPYGTA